MKMAKTKVAKLRALWTETPEQKQDKALDLELQASELSAKADYYQAEKKLHEQSKVVLGLKQKLENALSRVGHSWSPAEIVNAEIDLEEAERLEEELIKNKTRIEELIKEYL